MYSSSSTSVLESRFAYCLYYDEKFMPYWVVIAAVSIAYLFGSLSSAIIICKLMRLPDPRTQGSGNPGATNVLRIGGKKAAIITLIGDILKGVIPVLVAKALGFDELALCFITFAAFIGHLYPVFFRFDGGKGVATAAGCWLALAWPVGLAVILTWLVVAVLFRYSSLSALTASVIGPIYAWYFTNNDYTLLALIMSGFLLWRHRRNILNLCRGKEDKLFKKKNPA
jgi:glycerol-3-phosphate acyltransferase PlsY